MNTSEFSKFELDSKVRNIIRDVLAGFVEKLTFFNGAIQRNSDELVSLAAKVTATEHKLLYLEERFEQTRDLANAMDLAQKQFCGRHISISETCRTQTQSCVEAVGRLELELRGKYDRLDFVRSELELSRGKFKELFAGLHEARQDAQRKIAKFVRESVEQNAQIRMESQVMSDGYVRVVEELKYLSEQHGENAKNYELFVFEKEHVHSRLQQLKAALEKKTDAEQFRAANIRLDRDFERRLFDCQKSFGKKIDQKAEAISKVREAVEAEKKFSQGLAAALQSLEGSLTSLNKSYRESTALAGEEMRATKVDLQQLQIKLCALESEQQDRAAESAENLRRELKELESLIMFTKSDMIARTEEKLGRVNDWLFKQESKEAPPLE